MTNTPTEKAKRIIEHYGAQHQLVKLCEECAKLTQHWQALGDLMLTICECRFKKCPIEIVGMKKTACVPAAASTKKCKGCVMDWLNKECKT